MVSNRSFPRIKIELLAIFAYFSRMSNLNIKSYKQTINPPASNVGSVVEFSPATREARVRFPDVANFWHFSSFCNQGRVQNLLEINHFWMIQQDFIMSTFKFLFSGDSSEFFQKARPVEAFFR
jgi:hypothetical protein